MLAELPTMVPLTVTCQCVDNVEIVDAFVIRRSRYKIHMTRWDYAPSAKVVDRYMELFDRLCELNACGLSHLPTPECASINQTYLPVPSA